MSIATRMSRVSLGNALEQTCEAQGRFTRPRLSARRGRVLVVALLTAALAHLSAPSAAAAPPAACASVSSRELRVHVIDEVGVSSKTLEAAVAEASEIWGQLGLRLQWSFPPASSSAPNGPSVTVIIRRALRKLPARGAANSHGRVRRPLGWLVFGPDGQPGRLIEVSFEMITSVSGRGSYLNVKLASLPDFARHPIVGRGLGRVIAHELGHWLMGRGHARAGLMKSSFNAHDLTEPGPLPLPRAWMAIDANRQGAESSGCLPWALHRLT